MHEEPKPLNPLIEKSQSYCIRWFPLKAPHTSCMMGSQTSIEIMHQVNLINKRMMLNHVIVKGLSDTQYFSNCTRLKRHT